MSWFSIWRSPSVIEIQGCSQVSSKTTSDFLGFCGKLNLGLQTANSEQRKIARFSFTHYYTFNGVAMVLFCLWDAVIHCVVKHLGDHNQRFFIRSDTRISIWGSGQTWTIAPICLRVGNTERECVKSILCIIFMNSNEQHDSVYPKTLPRLGTDDITLLSLIRRHSVNTCVLNLTGIQHGLTWNDHVNLNLTTKINSGLNSHHRAPRNKIIAAAWFKLVFRLCPRILNVFSTFALIQSV